MTFASIVLGLRWGTLILGLALSPSQGRGAGPNLSWGLLLVAYAIWRSVRPLDLRSQPEPGHEWRQTLPFVGDIGVAAVAVVNTGFWSSPYAFCLLTGLVATGFARGSGYAVAMAAATSVAIGLPFAWAGAPDSVLVTGQWVTELLLVATLAGYSRRLFGDAERRHALALTQVHRLAEANTLLVSLHRVAQTLPASLNLEQVLRSTMIRLRGVIASDVAAVLVRDDTTATWVVLAGEGVAPGQTFDDATLPAPLAAATTSSVASLVVCLGPGEGLGPDLLSQSGLYAPLRAHGRLVGLVAVEHHSPGFYGRRELQLLDEFVDSAALAIDNARWFARLRAIGADEERVRIARDMHDRVGQSLASVGFTLDRMRSQVGSDPLGEEIDRLRSQIRFTLREVRETLADLRADVSDEHGLATTIDGYLARVRERTPLAVSFDQRESARLPLVQEREIWRIAQEAITNAERHAQAGHLSVRWQCDGHAAELVVADDGRGFVPGDAGRADSFGLTGMRERADSIGAALEIESAPGTGTMVRCLLRNHTNGQA